MQENNSRLQGTDRTRIFKTQRDDLWWFAPFATFVVFSGFIVYATWRTFENDFYQYQNYLSPFYSPKFIVNAKPFGFKVSPALLIMPFPLIFRASCYYYRKAYYRAFFWDPPACAVGEPYSRNNYSGEAGFPLVLQNIHRYTWYAILFFMGGLWWDTFKAFVWQGGLHVGIGSLVFLLNIVLLSGYTFGCHAWRHLSGGCLNCYSCAHSSQRRYSLWEKITWLNERHGLWAWASLVSVAFTDFYVRSLCTGLFGEVRFF